ncbi:MAG: Unknown protein [uncultured Aureispira sp.]|uniref:Uncharacterized protein n=1 Tax=uncultured Aureispira sp. TaxID=1331704 RepID=A0A6S6ULZ4_9BACT|nr:MAG: Unknown protein [uncultured Aureispira sp.]
MKPILTLLNYLKSKFKALLIGFILITSFVLVQYIGHYSSFFSKYGIALAIALPLILIWYWVERKFEQQVDSDHQRSFVWILLFVLSIPLGTYHLIQKEWHYQYNIPMCPCDEDDDRADRVGAICKDGIKSYATGRGTCSEHKGVKKWQCACD